MDIDGLVQKYERLAEDLPYWDAEVLLRDALTELASWYEQRLGAMSDKQAEVCAKQNTLKKHIRRLEERLGGYLTVGNGHVVHGTAEALARVQAYILLDSKHPVEARDTNSYFANQLQAAEKRIRQLESERVPEGMLQVPKKRPLPELLMASYHEAIGWNSCVDAMLAAAPQPKKEGE